MDPTAAPGGKEFFDEEVGNIVYWSIYRRVSELQIFIYIDSL